MTDPSASRPTKAKQPENLFTPPTRETLLQTKRDTEMREPHMRFFHFAQCDIFGFVNAVA